MKSVCISKMREFKFRVWEKNFEDPKMVYSDNEEYTETWDNIMFFFEMNGSENLMQWINLNDINKKNIYENDIISGDGVLGIVKFNETFSRYVLVIDNSTNFIDLNTKKINDMKLKVIGNTYENPELRECVILHHQK